LLPLDTKWVTTANYASPQKWACHGLFWACRCAVTFRLHRTDHLCSEASAKEYELLHRPVLLDVAGALDLCYEVANRKGRPLDRPNLHHRATSRLHLFFTAEMYE